MAEGLPEDAVFSRPLTVRIPEACRLTGIGRSKLYELIADGQIEVIKVGTISLVPVSSLLEFLRARTREGQQSAPTASVTPAMSVAPRRGERA